MKEQDKKDAPLQPASDTTAQPSATPASTNEQEQSTRTDDQQEEGDYAILASGLGIDE